MKWKFSFDSAFLLALITAFYYAAGVAYYNGYYGYIDVNVFLMEKSFNITAYTGFVNSLKYPALLVILPLLPLFYSYVLIGLIKQEVEREGFKKFLLSINNRFFIGDSLSRHEKRSRALFFKSLFLAMFVFFAILGLINAEEKGVSDAKVFAGFYKEGHKKSDNDNDNDNEVIYIKIKTDGDYKEMLLAGCGFVVCSAIDKKTGYVHYFNISDGYISIGNKPEVEINK